MLCSCWVGICRSSQISTHTLTHTHTHTHTHTEPLLLVVQRITKLTVRIILRILSHGIGSFARITCVPWGLVRTDHGSSTIRCTHSYYKNYLETAKGLCEAFKQAMASWAA